MKAGRICLAGLVLIVLAGGWLFAAPFGLAYQPMGARWSTATLDNLATGGALILIGAVTLIAYAAMAARDPMSRASKDTLTGPDATAAGSNDEKVMPQ